MDSCLGRAPVTTEGNVKCPYCACKFYLPGEAPVPGQYTKKPLPPKADPDMSLPEQAKAELAARTAAEAANG